MHVWSLPVAQAWNKEENDYHSSLITKWTTDPPKTINITQPEVGAPATAHNGIKHVILTLLVSYGHREAGMPAPRPRNHDFEERHF